MKILITGIKGFLGNRLIDSFKEKDYELYGLGTREEIFKDIQVYDSKDLDNLNVIPDIVIICHAAVSSGKIVLSNRVLFDVNVLLTEKICAKFRDAYIIYISTASIYNAENRVINERSDLKPQSCYAVSKLWGEYSLKLHKRLAIIRLSSLYGIGMKENTLIPNYINQALTNNLVEVWGDGSRMQNYIHVEDAISLIKMIVLRREVLVDEIFLGVSQIEFSNFQIAEIICSITNSKMIFLKDDNSRSLVYNNKYTRDLVGWQCEQKMKDNLNDYIKWKKEEF